MLTTTGIPSPSFFSSSSGRLEKLIFLRPSEIPEDESVLRRDSDETFGSFTSEFFLATSEFLLFSSTWSVPVDSDLLGLALFRFVEAVLLPEGLFLVGLKDEHPRNTFLKHGFRLYINFFHKIYKLGGFKKDSEDWVELALLEIFAQTLKIQNLAGHYCESHTYSERTVLRTCVNWFRVLPGLMYLYVISK